MVFMLPMATLAQAAQEPASGATFEITFESLWSPQTHPVDFPPDPHFSEFTGVTHNASVSFWTPGRLATQGVKDIAERGREAQFLKEIDRAITAGRTSTKLNIDGFYQETTPSIKVTIKAHRENTLLSLITMLAPRPSWFTGLHDHKEHGARGNAGWWGGWMCVREVLLGVIEVVWYHQTISNSTITKALPLYLRLGVSVADGCA